MRKLLAEIQIDDIPKLSFNILYSTVHWNVRKKHKDFFNKVIYYELLEYGKDDIKDIGENLEFEYLFKFKGRLLDVSNCFYIVKLVEDALKKNGVIKDDSIKYIRKITVTEEKSMRNTLIIKIFRND